MEYTCLKQHLRGFIIPNRIGRSLRGRMVVGFITACAPLKVVNSNPVHGEVHFYIVDLVLFMNMHEQFSHMDVLTIIN